MLKNRLLKAINEYNITPEQISKMLQLSEQELGAILSEDSLFLDTIPDGKLLHRTLFLSEGFVHPFPL